jgi:hypothetical protein
VLFPDRDRKRVAGQGVAFLRGIVFVWTHGRRRMDDVNESVRTHLDGVTPEKRRRDAETLLELMTRVTGESPRLWGSVIGFGQYHYKYVSGREGDAAAAGFAARKAATSIYLSDGIGRYHQQLRHLGPHPESDASTSWISTRSISRCSKPSLPSRTAPSAPIRTRSAPVKESRRRRTTDSRCHGNCLAASQPLYADALSDRQHCQRGYVSAKTMT